MFYSQKTPLPHEIFGRSYFMWLCGYLLKLPTKFYSTHTRNRFHLYKVLTIGLHSHLLNIAPLFAPDWFWFADATFALFGLPCFVATQCGVYYFHLSVSAKCYCVPDWNFISLYLSNLDFMKISQRVLL